MLSDVTREALLAFRRERDWEQFHTPKNLAIAITVEAAELLERFQWTSSNDVPADSLPAIRDEIADVCILLSYLAHDLGVDLDDAVGQKLVKNGAKYPVACQSGGLPLALTRGHTEPPFAVYLARQPFMPGLPE